jgi:phosphopantothenoylcysteine decarboxylase/phosphopantothenate--cysteine ligase
MRDAVAGELPRADALIMAAAPADFRPVSVEPQKIKKSASGAPAIELTQTDDILQSTIGLRKPGSVIVGFALETENLTQNGTEKLRKKSLDLIVANSAVEPGSGFGGDTNRVTFITRDGASDETPLMQKAGIADLILDRVRELMNGR